MIVTLLYVGLASKHCVLTMIWDISLLEKGDRDSICIHMMIPTRLQSYYSLTKINLMNPQSFDLNLGAGAHIVRATVTLIVANV